MAASAARLFFALWPDAAAAAALDAHARALARDCGGRVMRRDSLHLTLVFVGAVERSRLPQIEAAAAGCGGRRFALALDTTGFWRHNRIVWAGTSIVPPELPALVAALEGALAAIDCPFDRRAYAPHLTLLRNARAPASPPPLAAAWPVTEFTLVESVRDTAGARYATIARWPLAAG